jgi:hypothetical protein
MITTIPKSDLPNAKAGDPITLTGQVVGIAGDMVEVDVEPQTAAPANESEPGSFEEMEKRMGYAETDKAI